MKNCAWTLALALLVIAVPAAAKTPDGQTPAEETVCDGQKGAAFGLCNAYCEAMDCDSPAPHAAPKACEQVRTKFERITGSALPCDAVASCPCGQLELFSAFTSGTETINFCLSTSSDTSVYTEDGRYVVVLPGAGCQANGEEPFVPLTEDEAGICVQALRDAAEAQSVTCQTGGQA